MDRSYFETDDSDDFSRIQQHTSDPRLRFTKIQDIKDYLFEEPEYEYQQLINNQHEFTKLEGGEDDVESGALLKQNSSDQWDDTDPWTHIQREQYINSEQSAPRNMLGWIDYNDRVLSRKFQLLETPVVNEILTFAAWICNRKQCFLQIPLLFAFAYTHPEQIIAHYKTTQDAPEFKDIDFKNSQVRLKIAAVINLYMIIGALVFLLLVILPVKYMTKRSRPMRLPAVKRYINMRTREKNQPAHPSGDSAIAAYFFGLYFYIFAFPYFQYFLLPLVCLGRVWMFCHWFGDTIVGATFGLLMTMLWYSDPTFGFIIQPLFSAFF